MSVTIVVVTTVVLILVYKWGYSVGRADGELDGIESSVDFMKSQSNQHADD